MCGICAALGIQGDVEANRRDIQRRSRLIRHRGPDQTGIYQSTDGSSIMAFERLMVVDPTDGGKQPYQLSTPEGKIAWAVNCEIYNHEELRHTLLKDTDVPSACDSAIVGHLYAKMGGGPEMWNALDGIFAAVILDERTGEFTIARDPMGVCSLYWGRSADGGVWVASEMKALLSACVDVSWFPPGHYVRGRLGEAVDELPKPVRWFRPEWLVPEGSPLPTGAFSAAAMRDQLTAAVEKRLMADAPLGVLLSGGLDSSLVASIAARAVRRRHGASRRLTTFSIGVPGAPDLLAAREVATFLGTDHHEFTFTPREGLDALEDVIWHIESIEQVRAAVPLYLLARRIKALGVKVVLSGEGADEAFGGYLYFHKAPGPRDLHEETVRLLARLHQWDVLRANKSPFAFGVEARVPFLDKGLLALAMGIAPELKLAGLAATRHTNNGGSTGGAAAPRTSGNGPTPPRGRDAPPATIRVNGLVVQGPGADDDAAEAAAVLAAAEVAAAAAVAPGKKVDAPTPAPAAFVIEKHLLRAAFDTPEDPYLPDSVLWRQKEQFSDGVGYSWVDQLRDYAEATVSDAEWAARAERFPDHTPLTREYYLLRSVFDHHFPHPRAFSTVPKGLSIACSTPVAIAWDDDWAGTHEISGRAISAVHESAQGFRVRPDGLPGEDVEASA